jgi:hypothetical protein
MRSLIWIATLFCFCFVFTSPALAQVGNGVLTGTVVDSSEARVPGVTITAVNTQTSVQTTVVSNETGSYNMPNLVPGNYTLKASLPGFRTQTLQNINLGGSQTLRFNFTLQVAATQTQVDVIVDAEQLLTQAGGTIGDVLPETSVRNLPLVGNDVLDLVNVLGGVQLAPAGTLTFGTENNQSAGASRWTTLAGVSATFVNTSVNGLTVTDSFYAGIGEPDNTSGILSVTRINPDLVGEVRLILTPVDAELGRGNGQIQITTRSGTNKFAGTARWDVRNPALNARSWADNSITDATNFRNGCNPSERGDCTPPLNWYNQNQFTVSYGGPVVRNKTFFFALYDQQISRLRTPVNNTVLTPCARNGIFRYYPGWVNGNVLSPAPQLNGLQNQARPVVDFNGNAVRPDRNVDGTTYTDNLRYVSVFGPIDFATFPTAVAADCSNIRLTNGTLTGASSSGNAWDTQRWNTDPTGFVTKVMTEVPLPNNFEIGDGLNTAGNRYIRARKGSDGGGFFGAPGAAGDGTERKQINLKIDHHLNQNHRVATQLSYERDNAQINPPDYAQGFWGFVRRRPLSFSANFNSTLSSSMVNEVRFGLRKTNNRALESMDDPDYKTKAREFFPVVNGIPTIVSLSIVGQPMMAAAAQTQGNNTRTLTFADTFSWSHGAHSLRLGGEFRANHSDTFNNPNVIPRVTAGTGAVPVQIASCGNCDFEALLDSNANYGNGNTSHFQFGNRTNLENLLLLHSGSIGGMSQFYFVNSANRLDKFESYSTSAQYGRTWLQREAAMFAQDDWKITRDLTVNGGLRWEYYGPPWEGSGLLPAPKGSNLAGAFGISGDGWEDWWQANPKTNGSPTTMEFVGPHSPNTGRGIYKKDTNNFGPVLGFSWNVPWFGAGKTVVRGGYSVTFQGGGNFAALDGTAGEVPGSVWPAMLGAASNTYLRLADFGANHKSLATPSTFNFRNYGSPAVVPLPPDSTNSAVTVKPMSPVPLRFRPLGGIPTEFYDDSYSAPYIQNFTLAMTRNLNRKVTLDVRYVATAARKLYSENPVNSPNFLTNGLKQAFDAARAGGESQLLNDLTSSVNGAFGGSGATWLRNQTTGCFNFVVPLEIAQALAIGDYAAVADCLGWVNGGLVGEPGEQGLVLKRSVNARFPTGVPDNFIVANPQFGNLNIVTNSNKTNYHSLQTQVTLRPTFGLTYQGTFTWSKLLGSPAAPNPFGFQGNGFVSYYSMDRRNEDYGLQFAHRKFDYRSYGTFVLPFGPGQFFLKNSTGWLARAVEDWQVSAIFNVSSGAPMTIVGRSGLYESRSSSNFTPWAFSTSVAPADLTAAGASMFGNFSGIGKVDWQNGAASGTYFPGTTFARVVDPQCAGVTTLPAGTGQTLQSRCNTGLSALAVVSSSGQTIVLQNSQPGTRGNLGVNTMIGPGNWALDGSLSKGIRIDETKRIQFRFDATNILNHPSPCAPAFCAGDGRGTNLALNPISFSPLGAFGMVGAKNLALPRQFQATVRFDF